GVSSAHHAHSEDDSGPSSSRRVESRPPQSDAHAFFREGEEGRYAGGPLDVAAREAALRAVEMEEDPLYPHTSLPPGVLDERRQKFAKVVLVVVAGSALLVA